MNDLAIDLSEVSKTYQGRVHALQGISMQVRRGEIFGLLGPNGAGKSTLVKIMMTVLRPTRAIGTLLGKPIGHKPTLAHVGYLPENPRFPRYLTGRQTVELFGAMGGVDYPTAKRRSAELLESLGMTAWAQKSIVNYSKGMLQRVGLAQALINDPDLIVLDEPTDGLDPVGRRDTRDLLLRLRNQGKSVFINSHLLSELEMICDRVAILVRGQVVRQGTVDELTRHQERYEIELAIADPAAARPILQGLLGKLGAAMKEKQPVSLLSAFPRPVDVGELPGGVWVELEECIIRLGTANPDSVQPVVDAFRAAGLTIRRLVLVRQTLEQLFMETITDAATGKTLAPGAAPQAGPAARFPYRGQP